MLSATVITSLLLVPTSAASSGCSDSDLVTGGCGVDNTGTAIVLDGTRTSNPDPGTFPISQDDWQQIIGDWSPAPPVPDDFTLCIDAWDSGRPCFLPGEDGEDPDEEQDEETGIPPITITDLARFAPDGSVITGEPANVGVAGLPTNFVADASVHTVDGELFGFPLAVRFTPAAFDFAFGDGSTAATTTGGETWEALGQAQFTPTDTSHTYAERGTYTAQVDVRYTAEIDLGVGWFPITGEVTSAGAPQEIRIFEAHTALVAHTCEQAPSSPGC